MTITINHFLVVSFLLFSIGFFGVLVRRNFLTVLMSVELMLNAVNLNLIAFSRRLSDLTGQVFSIFSTLTPVTKPGVVEVRSW